jgi:hypothetical protein
MIIETTKGQMDEEVLLKKTGTWDLPTEFGSYVEYYIGDEMVHRSATVNLKEGTTAGVDAGQFGG